MYSMKRIEFIDSRDSSKLFPITKTLLGFQTNKKQKTKGYKRQDPNLSPEPELPPSGPTPIQSRRTEKMSKTIHLAVLLYDRQK